MHPRKRTAVAALLLTIGTLAVGTGARGENCPWVGSSDPVDDRVAQVLAQMTRAEKLSMVHGALKEPTGVVGPIYAGLVPAIPRLCIPQLGFLDGPAGTGDGMTGVTQLPAPIALAATWDPELARSYGGVIAAEDAGKGANVALGPALDIVRDPRAGRGFEAFGEDPSLTSRLGVAEIEAIQDAGLIAQAKHYAAYTHETFRDTEIDDVAVDERTLQEIYLPAFDAAVNDAGVLSVMCSYNYVNGVHACNHTYLLTQVLKGQMGFEGFVTSDWYALHGGAEAANTGIDMQMPDVCFLGPALDRAIDEGRVAIAQLDEMVRRILRSTFVAELFDTPPGGSPDAIVTTPEHAAVARKIAAEGMVLLRNAGDVLPLNPSDVSSIAVIGGAARGRALTGGGGSSHVNPPYVVSPLAGIKARAGDGIDVTYDNGLVPLTAAAAAGSADVAIVFASLMQGEFKDRLTIELFPTDTLLIEMVAAANPNTIVVLNTGSATAMPWLDSVAGVVQAWYPGQEYGNALADVLFGDVNPSAKLPVTFPESLLQVPAKTPYRYTEGLAVGYRWYDQEDLTPLFPFGFGLSYTSFAFDDLSVSPVSSADGVVTIGADVTNTGSRAGAEVVQLYLSHPAAAGEPPKQLKGFQRVALAPGETKHVSFTLDGRALSVWDTAAHRWIARAALFGVQVGNSSRNLPLSGSFSLTSTFNTSNATPPPPDVGPPSLVNLARDWVRCPKDLIAPYVNGVLSVTGFPPLEVLGRPVP